jgi:hypothetical protein
MAAIISGAAVPVLNSFPIDSALKSILTSVVAATGGTIAIGMCTLFDYKETWRRSRSFAEAIKMECFNYVNSLYISSLYDDCGDAPELKEEEKLKKELKEKLKKENEKRFVNNINAIFSEENRQWNESKMAKVSSVKKI